MLKSSKVYAEHVSGGYVSQKTGLGSQFSIHLRSRKRKDRAEVCF